jgi:hypothetical protein
MPPARDLTTPSASPPPATFDVIGRAPLIPGDDSSGYDTLLSRVSAAVRPGDVIEEAWVRDVVDLIWEAVRLRRLKAALLTACADRGLRDVLTGINVTGNTAFALAGPWAAREPAAVEKVDAILAAAGLGIDHVMAHTLRRYIDQIERIDRMIASAEARRSAALRDIAHHREHLAASLRAAANEAITDAEFEVVSPAAPAAAPATEQRPAASD